MDYKDIPIFTRAQLALRNGRDKKEIWVAHKGIIYDVTHSKMWKDGMHYGNWAGQDLTRELHEDAPHSHKILENYTIVGLLKT